MLVLVATLATCGIAAAIASAAVTPIPASDPDYAECVDLPNGAALQGDGADDTINGTSFGDLLKGGGGNDTLNGLGSRRLPLWVRRTTTR